jgi:hypothetical protein
MRGAKLWLASRRWLRIVVLPLVLALGLIAWLNFSDEAAPLRADEPAKLTDPVPAVDNSAAEDGKLFPSIDHSQIQVAPEKQSGPRRPASDAEYKAQIDAGRAKQRDFFEQFVASGQDPRSLPRASISHIDCWCPPMTNLQETIAAAHAVVVGTVSRVEFTYDNGLGRSRASISVEKIIKNGALPRDLVVTQIGGPVIVGNGTPSGQPALGQMENDELLLKGDKAVLFLRTHSGHTTTLPDSGIVFIQDGLAVPEAASRFGADIRGLTLPQLLALIDANR